MSSFSAALWLQNARIAVQSAWFVGFVAALGTTIWALQSGRQSELARVARVLWAGAMGMLILMWLGGATLEMVRRAALVSGWQMMLALAAFSFLAAGTLSLGREWFGANLGAPLRADKIALSLLVLTLAGWWFGGLSLEQNALWLLCSPSVGRLQVVSPRAPDAWALLLGGATLLGASRGVRSMDETIRRVTNPRLSSWWIAGTALFLAVPQLANHPAAASVFVLAGAVFGSKIWRVRSDCPRFLRAPLGVRVAGVIFLGLLPLMLSPWKGNATGRATEVIAWKPIAAAWQEPHQIAAWALISLLLVILFGPLRLSLRLAIFGRFFDRALLHGALAGFGLATLFSGPGGAVFWVFWPLCGLFFDLLAPHESLSTTSAFAEPFSSEVAVLEPAP